MAVDSMVNQICALKTDDIVKDLLQGWTFVREKFAQEIQKFRFKDDTKIALRQLAKEFYAQYSDQYKASEIDLRLDPGILRDFFSVQIYGPEGYALFSYPYNILAAESLNPKVYSKVIRRCTTHIDFKTFLHIFWQEKFAIKVRFSKMDLLLLNELFKGVETRSSIGVPSAPEVLGSNKSVSNDTIRRHYTRLLGLHILQRFSVVNYAIESE